MDIEEYISARVDDQIRWYSKKSQQAQKMYKSFQLVEIIIAATIPVLSAYSPNCSEIALIIGILGSVIVVIESITKLNSYHEKWIQYRTTCELLKYHKFLYLTRTSPYNEVDDTIENLFIHAVEDIISSENSQWKLTVSNKNKSST